jgi:hypothetical protein
VVQDSLRCFSKDLRFRLLLAMAANDPGLAPLTAPAEDPTKGAIDVPGDDTPVAPDQFDPKYETTKKEIWAYYS